MLTPGLRGKLLQVLRRQVNPASKDGQAAIAEGFKHDVGEAMELLEGVHKEFLERGMKLAGFTSEKVGNALYNDSFDREGFFHEERRRTKMIGKPGFDDMGYPLTYGEKAPFNPLSTLAAATVLDPEPDALDDETPKFQVNMLPQWNADGTIG